MKNGRNTGLFNVIPGEKGKVGIWTTRRLWRTGYGAEGCPFQACAIVLFPCVVLRSQHMQELCISTVENFLDRSEFMNPVCHTRDFLFQNQ